MFTGDSSGKWLFSALHRYGWCNQAESLSRDDGLLLEGAYISAVARCAPPQNKPAIEELRSCQSFLDREWELLKHKKVILALGQIAFQATLRMILRKLGESIRGKFSHGMLLDNGTIKVLASYHPSRQNTQTGKLTEKMWDMVFSQARALMSI